MLSWILVAILYLSGCVLMYGLIKTNKDKVDKVCKSLGESMQVELDESDQKLAMRISIITWPISVIGGEITQIFKKIFKNINIKIEEHH